MELKFAACGSRAVVVCNSRIHLSRLKSGTFGAIFALALSATFAMTDARATTAVGAIHGSSGVSATGAATYSIPIQVSPGTNGMQPALALTYDSQSGDGLAGYGWTLSGLSTVTRCPQTPKDDGVTFNVPVRYNANDDFCLDGTILRLTNGTSGADGATYGKQFEDFSLITSYTDASATGGPSYFTVHTKDGHTLEYGNTPDSKVYAEGTTAVRVWALDKVTDANGNSMAYTYVNTSDAGLEYWPVSISYTANGSTAADHEVDFAYAVRPAGTFLTGYTHGSLSRNTTLLQTITSKYQGTPVYTYTLSYDQDPVDNRNRLTSVQECGADGSCLPSTTIAWSNSHAGWNADTSTGISVTDAIQGYAAHLVDVDGDGIADLVYPDSTSGDWKVAFGQSAGGLGSPVDTGLATFGNVSYSLAMDYNGDGRTDLLVPLPTGQGWWLFQATGGRSPGLGGIFRTPGNSLPDLSGNNSVTGQPMYQGNVWMADFSGGDLSDMFYNTGTSIKWLQNNGPPNNTFSSAISVYTGGALNTNTSHDYADVGLDFNGSGRVGALVYNNSTGAWNGLNPSNDTLGMFGAITGDGTKPAVPFDTNGDGLTDLLTVDNNNHWQVSISRGTGFTTLTTSETYYNDQVPLVVDYYGDGSQVALMYNISTSAWDILDTTNHANGLFAVTLTPGVAAPYGSSIVIDSIRVGSIESKGLSDLLYLVNAGTNVYTWHYRLHQGVNSVLPDLVSKVTDGLGNYCQFSYSTLSSGTSFTRGSYSTYPVHSFQSPVAVVSTYTESDGMGGTYAHTYTYSDARVDTQGHGFLGFASRTITDGRSGNVETITYDQAFPYVGMVTRDQLKTSTGDLIRETDNSGTDQLTLATVSADPQPRYFPFFDSSITHDYDNIGGTVQEISNSTTTVSASDFDNYGDLLYSTVAVVDKTQSSSPTYKTSKTNTYVPASSSSPPNGYCANLPQSVMLASSSVTRTVPAAALNPGAPAVGTRTTTFTPDPTTCRVDSQTASDGADATTLTTGFHYDSFGNISETDVSGTNLPATRTTLYSNAGANGEFPTQVTYAPTAATSFSAKTAWRYDLGVKTSDTDPNGHSTSYLYDGFGRSTQVTRAADGTTNWTYVLCTAGGSFCPSDAAYEVTTSRTDGSTTITMGYTAYDSLGRPVETGTMLLGGVMSLVDTQYDQMGHTLRVSKPYLVSAPYTGGVPTAFTTYSYDLARDRLTGMSTPQNAGDSCSPSCADTISYGYSGFTTTASHTVADSASSSSTHVTTTTRDAMGEILEVDESKGSSTIATQYNYDAFGNLVATKDADGKKTLVSYDGLGHKTGMTDPNMGTWSYVPDALGEVLCQTDAKGQSLVFTYDNLGRRLTKSENSADGCTGSLVAVGFWAYDQSGALGLPASVSDSSSGTSGDFLRTYAYDGDGRVRDVTTNINSGAGAGAYTVSTGYDSFGRVQTITYPVTGVTPTFSGTAVAAAHAVPSATVNVNTQVTLDGSDSTPSPSSLQYQWQQTGGPSVTGFVTSAEQPSFTPTVGGTYSFQLQVIAAGSSALSAAFPISVTVKPLPPASAPTFTSSTPSVNGSVSLSWSPAPGGADSYDVWQSTNGGAFTKVQNVAGTTATVSGLAGNTYAFAVGAKQNGVSGDYGPQSTNVSVIVPPTGTTASPTTVGKGVTFTVSWPASGPVTSYVVRGDNNSGFTSPTDHPITGTPVPTSWSNSLGTTGTYYYKVKACIGGTCTAFGNVVSVVVSGSAFVAPQKGDLMNAAQMIARGGSAAEAESGAVEQAQALAILEREHRLLAGKPMQPSEAELEARFDRLHPSIPQSIALAGASGQHPDAGHPSYAQPVYAAYADAHPQTVGGTSYRFVVQYNYDPSSGALESVSNADTHFLYWRAATDMGVAPVDAFGHIIASVDGNNVSTVTAYDQATGAVTGFGTAKPTDPATTFSVQDLIYSWDGFGNLKQRCDANRGLVENFGYDHQDRVTSSQVYTGAAAGTCPGTTSSPGAAMGLSYDDVGNIQARANTGITVGAGSLNDTYTYGDSSHPYAVTAVTSMPGTYAYDANGNMTSGNGRSITWNDDNMPISITSSVTVNGNNAVTGSSTFAYSPDLQRYRQETTDSIAGNSTTTYIGGLFEVISTSSSTQYRHTILAGGTVVAVHTLDQSGAATTAYIHADHLGSSDTVTDDTGAVVQQASFDAFGLRRSPLDWSYGLTAMQIAAPDTAYPTISNLKSITDKGFTGQEQLDDVGLVTMNGRIYDPSIGRMISADPTTPSQYRSQAFNRYAYVYNNPLAMTDPSGFAPCAMKCKKKDPGVPNIPLHDQPTNTGSHIPGVDTGCSGCSSGVSGDGGEQGASSGDGGGDGGGCTIVSCDNPLGSGSNPNPSPITTGTIENPSLTLSDFTLGGAMGGAALAGGSAVIYLTAEGLASGAATGGLAGAAEMLAAPLGSLFTGTLATPFGALLGAGVGFLGYAAYSAFENLQSKPWISTPIPVGVVGNPNGGVAP